MKLNSYTIVKTNCKYYIFYLIFFTCVLVSGNSFSQNYLKLWYDKPATNWNEALPIGNGRLAAMVFGGTAVEQIQLNEETVWAGEPGNNIIPGVYDSIVRIRQLIFQGKYKEAQDLSNKAFPRRAPADNNYGMQYQPVGNLFIHFPGHDKATNFYRDLNIQQAMSTVTYKVKDVNYKREIFASFPDNVIIVRITADKPKSISCTLGANSPHKKYDVSATQNLLSLSGTTGDKDNKKGKIQFHAFIRSTSDGGTTITSNTMLPTVGRCQNKNRQSVHS